MHDSDFITDGDIWIDRWIDIHMTFITPYIKFKK